MNAIEISNLHKSFGATSVLKGLDLVIKPGSFFGLLGPNGAGKSTTINIISGLTMRSSGDVNVFGHDVDREYKKTRSLIGLSQQEFNLDRLFTIEQLFMYQGGMHGLSGKELKEKVYFFLMRFGLWEHRHQRPHRLSGGQKRRAMVAKALLHDPKILILDEPTAGIDVELRLDLWDYLRRINKEGKTILLTTHYLEEAKELCDEIAILHQGQILIHESTPNVLKQCEGNLLNYFVPETKREINV